MVETKRDLTADLALCDAATPKIEDTLRREWSSDDYDAIIAFIAESRDGWPDAIRRAIAAEAEVDRIRAIVERMRTRREALYYNAEG